MQLRTKFGNTPKNQYIVDNVFISYGTKIAKFADGVVTLDAYYWDYSVTTGYYRNQFLGEGIAETRKKIKSGEYLLANLN